MGGGEAVRGIDITRRKRGEKKEEEGDRICN